MMSQPNRPLEDMVFQDAVKRQRQLDTEQPITPDELQLTPSERAASKRKYFLTLGLIALSVLLVLFFLSLVLFFLYR
jgi:hypothetical protein